MTSINNQFQRTLLANQLVDAKAISKDAAGELSQGKVSFQDMATATMISTRLKGSPLEATAEALAKAVGAAGASQSTLATLGASALDLRSPVVAQEAVRNIR